MASCATLLWFIKDIACCQMVAYISTSPVRTMAETIIPTLAYLGDVDKARELLMNQPLLTRTQHFRVDTEYYGDGYRDVVVEKNMLVTVKAIGVGTRSFPVKIIVEDENGNQFYQNVAMSKTNSGIREEGFSYDAEMYSFAGSFEFLGANMTVSSNIVRCAT